MPATYSIDITASDKEELGIQWAKDSYNAREVAANPNFVALTAKQFLKQHLNDYVLDLKKAYKQKLRDDAANAVNFD